MIWGLQDKSRFLQYPYLASGVWLFYMIPMAYGSLKNPEKFPSGVLSDGGFEVSLAMCIFCLACGWWGWLAGMKTPPREPPAYPIPSAEQIRNLFLYGCILCGLGLVGAWGLARLMGGFVAQFTQGAHYSMEWSGDPVKYNFFINLTFPGLVICLLAVLRRPA